MIDYFNAYSGNALSIEEKEELREQYKYENFVSYKDKQNKISYFCLDKEWQKQKDKGAIPEGIYYIDINKSKNDKSSGIRTYDNAWYSLSRNKEGEKWGKYNIPIYTNKECTNTIESTTQRNNFYIHGGESYGDNGGIDLAKEDTRFFKVLESIKEYYKDILESLKDNEGRMVVRLGVGYGERKSEIDLRGKRTPNGGVVEWISQFDNTKGGMGTKAGNTACKLTCDEILRRSGVSLSETPTSYRGSILYQISIEKDVAYYRSNDTHKRISDGNLNTKEQNEYLDYDERILREGLKYIDTELEKGYPITIGVDHTYQHKGGFNSDLSTDHFVVIVGRKYDEKGKLYYLFYEVGTRYKDKGISDDNRFYIENNTLHGTPAHNMNRHYVVTQIRRNLSYKKD